MSMFTGFYMKSQSVCSCIFISIYPAFRFFYHKMNVKNHVTMRSEHFYYWRTKSEVWNKMTIHYIDMNPVCSRVFYGI